MTLRPVLTLIIFLALVAAAALTGMNFLPGAWYEALAKPEWTPPNWVFPPAWTALYIMIAVAGWRVFEKQGIVPALIVWAVSLQLNAAWSVFMFKEHNIGLALADIAAHVDRAAERGDPVPDPGQAGAVGRIGATATVVSDVEAELVIGEPGPDVHTRGAGMLDRVGDGLGGHEVGRRFDAAGQPSIELVDHHDGQRRPIGQRRKGRAQAGFREDRRMDAASQFTDVGDRGGCLRGGGLELCDRLRIRIRPEVTPQHLEGQLE